MSHATPSPSRLLGKIIARLRTPAAEAPSKEIVSLQCTPPAQSASVFVKAQATSYSYSAGVADEEEEDIPMPEFECDWLKDDWLKDENPALPVGEPLVVGETGQGDKSRSTSSSSTSRGGVQGVSAAAGRGGENNNTARDASLASSTAAAVTLRASTASTRTSSPPPGRTTRTHGSGSSYYSSSSNMGSSGSGSGSGSMSSVAVDSSGDKVRRNAVLARSLNSRSEMGATGAAGRRSASVERSGSRGQDPAAVTSARPSLSRQGSETLASATGMVRDRSLDFNKYKSPELSSSTTMRTHSRTTSADRLLSASVTRQVSLSSSTTTTSTTLNSTTPGVPRLGTHTQVTAKRNGIGSKWKATLAANSNGKPLRKAGRVIRSEEGDEAESEGGNQTTSPDSQQEASLSASTGASPPLLHSQSQSSVPLTALESAVAAAASSGTMNPSAYINRDASTRSRSALGNYGRTTLANSSSAADTSSSSLASSTRTSPLLSNDPVPGSSRYPLSISTGSSTSIPPSRQLVPSPAPLQSYLPPSSLQHNLSSSLDSAGRNEANELRRTQIFDETAARLAGHVRTPAALDTRSHSSTSTLELQRSRDRLERETTLVPGRLGSSLGHYSAATKSAGDASPTEQGSTGRDGERDRSTTLRQGKASSGTSTTSTILAGRDGRQYEEFQDENQYETVRHSRPPISTPSYAASSGYQSASSSASSGHSTSTGRAILGETYRGTNSSLSSQSQSLSSSTKSSSSSTAGSAYPGERGQSQQQQQQQRDTQAPLRDRSPGMAEATPSAQHYYPPQYPTSQQQQSAPPQQQQAYQYQQQQSQQHSQHQAPLQQQQQQMAPPPKKKVAAPLVVNGISYHRAGLLGKGGSSRVYRVLDASNNLFAIKRVDIGRNDAETRASFLNEIQLLEKLKGNPQIIRLIDSEMNENKKTLMMVMEVGEADLNGLLADHLGKRISMNFIRYIWEQMLEAVQVIHDENVVHTDLKPANFVLVKGHLKLIDFGISKAIANDTTNIGRDQQIGTANYMPPEALMDSGLGQGGKRLMKLGRAADVWSLGCILHQMVYGHTPFSHFKDVSRKILAIQNPLYVIHYPLTACPLDERGEEKKELTVAVGEDLVASMKGCLVFDHRQRITIPELLHGAFLRGETAATLTPPESKLPTVDEETMKHLVDRVTKSVTGRVLSNEDGRMMANKLMNELRDAQPLR